MQPEHLYDVQTTKVTDSEEFTDHAQKTSCEGEITHNTKQKNIKVQIFNAHCCDSHGQIVFVAQWILQ